ncbi:Zinc/iron permease [Lactifluus subvellereus]|nr:Zinc/iron permease [Lactifluus subvellereus]
MSALRILLTLSALLGLTSFGIGILPLSFTFSGAHMSKLSCLGTGLLLGAALGIIIPEGIEALAYSRPSSPLEGISVALPLLFGFTFMLVVEQLSSSHSHHHHPHTHRSGYHASVASPDSVFDVELAGTEDEPEGDDAPRHQRRPSFTRTNVEDDLPPSAYPITVGLVVHGLADGLALGMSAVSNNNESSPSYGLSLVVFLALAVHKAPTALAYTLSLMSTSLSRADCKKHLLLFSASTPVGAIASYASYSLFGSDQVDGVGTALLISAGSFLYVATVLQPVSHDRSSSEGVSPKMRILLLVLGIFTPFAMGTLLDHGHGHNTAVIPP